MMCKEIDTKTNAAGREQAPEACPEAYAIMLATVDDCGTAEIRCQARFETLRLRGTVQTQQSLETDAA